MAINDRATFMAWQLMIERKLINRFRGS